MGGFGVGLVGAAGVVGLSGVVSNLTFFFGCWDGIGERGLSGLEVGLVRFFMVCVVTRRGVVFQGSEGIGCASPGCVVLWLLSSVTIRVVSGSSSPVRVYLS